MFFKIAAIPTNVHHISAYSRHKVVILMAIPMFLRSRNRVEQSFTHTKCTKAHMPVMFLFKMAPPNLQILDYKPISVQHVQELSSRLLYPGF